ncbi:MAG: PAS domain S-box protein, partial [Candidatus Hydrothermarchaeaceae archaeon]
GKTAAELSPGKDYWEDDKKVMETGTPLRDIIEPVETSEGTKWVQTDKIPYLDSDGNIIGIIGFAVDITERKRAEEALRESEETYRSLFQNANDGIVTIDLDGNYIFPNPKLCEITGYSREELDGQHFSKIVHPDDVPIVEKHRKARIKGKRAAEGYEYRIISKDGGIKYVETRPSVIKRDGKVVGVQTIVRDITEKRKHEAELSALLDISRNISTTIDLDRLLNVAVKETVEATGVDWISVALLDEEGRVRVPVAYTKSGEKTGSGDVFDLDDLSRMKEAVEKKKTVYVSNSLDPKTQSPLEIALAKKLNIGSGIHVPLIARGRVVGVLNLAAVGKARKFTRREIEFYKAIANQLSAMIANARLYEGTKLARNEAEFYVDLMSHDINNANTVAMGMLELLAQDADLGNERDYVEKAIMAIKRSANLIYNVRKVQLAKSAERRAFEKRNLDTILQEVIMDVKNFHIDKIVKINYAPRKAVIFTDGLIRDLFWNLLDNAAKYDPHHEVGIDVDVKDKGKEWLVRIKDRGKGIPDDFKTAIFERFKRIDTGTRGSGVGLYLCKLLVDKYGGKIWVENRVRGDRKKGSVFHITLPKA